MTIKLLDYTLFRLNISYATKFIINNLNENYDKEFGENICSMVFGLCGDKENYDKALQNFINFSKEFLELQTELENTGHYRYSDFIQVKSITYDNAKFMQAYLTNLLFSQALWINHYKIFQFFMENFSKNNKDYGKAVEVPVGTGIFLSQFGKDNPKWELKGYDISKYAVKFAKKVSKADIRKKNVFDIKGKWDKIICGELMEHLENPDELLKKLDSILADNGRIFLVTAIWTASIDHIYLFKSAKEVRDLLNKYFKIESEIALNVYAGKNPNEKKTPINYACILSRRGK